MSKMITRYLDGIQCHDPRYKLPTLYVLCPSLMLSFASFVPASVHYVAWIVSSVLLLVLGTGDV